MVICLVKLYTVQLDELFLNDFQLYNLTDRCEIMATNGVNLLKLVSASVFAANQAGKIIRDIMRRGDLAIVEKVRTGNLSHDSNLINAGFFS